MDAHQLTTHLKDTPTYITRHRNQITTTPQQDTPGRSPAKSKPPLNLNALHWADQEAATIGNIALHCAHLGTLPTIDLHPLWVTAGQCHGLRPEHPPHALAPIIEQLCHYAPFIIGTTGITPLLDYAQRVRACSQAMFPQEHTEWITITQAMALTGRAEKTINDWRRAGWVRHIKDEYGTLYDKKGVTTICDALTVKRTMNLPNGKP